MAKKNFQRTKIIRVQGGEVYWRKYADDDWEVMYKDTSSICGNRDTKFKSMGSYAKFTLLAFTPVRPTPEGFLDDLVSPYGRHEYAEGHAPANPFSWR